jgi:exopolyphosphatase / guanosine-5'-triphosphate,3'-diphosphate pyrophosphatase
MSDAEFAAVPSAVPVTGGGDVLHRRAVIDIGTNSIKLLVADAQAHEVQPVLETSEQTRLGQGFYRTGRLQPTTIQATVEAVGRFVTQARDLHATKVRLIATSAVRDATNAAELTAAVERLTGFPVEIISGEQEADWVFAGVATNPRFATSPLLVLDVGGGSTEFICGTAAHARFRRSYALGTVRLLDAWELADPPDAGQRTACQEGIGRFLREHVAADLTPIIRGTFEGALRLVGTGGTPAILARIQLQLPDYDRNRIESVCLTRADVHAIVERLWRLSLAERRLVPGLPPKRADVILAGALIYAQVMDVFGFAQLEISTRGLRFAVAASLA